LAREKGGDLENICDEKELGILLLKRKRRPVRKPLPVFPREKQ